MTCADIRRINLSNLIAIGGVWLCSPDYEAGPRTIHRRLTLGQGGCRNHAMIAPGRICVAVTPWRGSSEVRLWLIQGHFRAIQPVTTLNETSGFRIKRRTFYTVLKQTLNLTGSAETYQFRSNKRRLDNRQDFQSGIVETTTRAGGSLGFVWKQTEVTDLKLTRSPTEKSQIIV